MAARGEERIHIDAPAERIYELVSDVTRMGQWSPETYECEWVDGATGPAVGARFKGRNKQGLMRWSTMPEVKVADPGREFTFATKMRGKDATRWSYVMAPSPEGGTDVTESWEILSSNAFLDLFAKVTNRPAKLGAGMRTTLERLKAAAESSP